MNMWLTVLFRKGTESSRKLFRAADGGRRHSLSPSLSFAAQRSQADDDAHGHGSAYVIAFTHSSALCCLAGKQTDISRVFLANRLQNSRQPSDV